MSDRVGSSPDARWTLLVAILGSSMAFLDATVVNVALPTMQRELGITTGLVQWIVEAYALPLSAFVLVGGALGDRLGRRRVFLAGVTMFAIASAACGLAPGPVPLVLARALQGLGAALLVPGSLALISAAYSDEDRGAAIGVWSAGSAVMSAVGPVAGGWVVAHGSWRWLFFFNVPVAAATLLFGRALVLETRDASVRGRLDWPGATLATLGLGLIVYALLGSEDADGNRRMVPLLCVGALALVAFLVVEARGATPMVPLSLFRHGTFAGANLLTFLLYAALGGALFFVPFNLMQVQRYTATEAGAALLPMVITIAVMSRGAGALATRLDAKTRIPVLLVIGPLVAALGFALLAVPATGGGYFATFFPGILALGVGMGCTVAPLTTTVMGAVDHGHAGLASGINNAVARTAGLLAIAILGVVLRQRFDGALDARLAGTSLSPVVTALVSSQRIRLGGADLSSVTDEALRESLRRAFEEAYVSAFRTVMIVGAVLATLAAVAAIVMVRPSAGRVRS